MFGAIKLKLQVGVKSLPPLALDRTIFPRHTKKLAQKPAKPLNSLEDLAYTIDERFVLAYPSQAVGVKSLPPLALDRTIFPRHTKKLAQKPAKPLNSLEDLAYTIDERFVLAYPSQAVIDGALDSVPT
ncbi:hypothetical protein DSO57_1028443 [Entomophthora muscae]|uniref:Uncharacterized protein n=1 Tax=Entomophthora muscae TaxID=34485 RepID=A0ACC2SE32_9FUNG|nr:hypothetical protein DSO57_1028443 [Entomophthora muscae]